MIAEDRPSAGRRQHNITKVFYSQEMHGPEWYGAGAGFALGWSSMVHVADSENPANLVY
jgi:hypothetical protein